MGFFLCFVGCSINTIQNIARKTSFNTICYFEGFNSEKAKMYLFSIKRYANQILLGYMYCKFRNISFFLIIIENIVTTITKISVLNDF